MFKKQPWKMEEAIEGADGGSVDTVDIVEQPEESTPEPMDARSVIEREMNKIENTEKLKEEETTEKPRDESGKFKSKETEEQKPEEVKPEAENPAEPEQKERNPWGSWKQEHVAEIKKLPKSAQDYILQRQDQFHKGLDQYREEANYARTIKKAVAQFEPYMAQLGVTPDVAFANLLKTEQTLRTGDINTKMQVFRQLAHDYGVDLSNASQQPFDANLYQMQQQLSQLQAQLQTSQVSQQSAEEGQITETIEQFAQSREYFNDVRETMADLLDRGLAKDLDDAYTKAVRLDDGVFSKMQAKQRADAERQRLAQGNQAAKAAKAAAVSVRGSPTGVSHSPIPTSTEEAVRQAMARHGL